MVEWGRSLDADQPTGGVRARLPSFKISQGRALVTGGSLIEDAPFARSAR
jgi:hypothetical protein